MNNYLKSQKIVNIQLSSIIFNYFIIVQENIYIFNIALTLKFQYIEINNLVYFIQI